MDNSIVIIFLKIPQRNVVKTRLSIDLDEIFVLELYKGFVCDLLEVLKDTKYKAVYFWPGEKGVKALQNWLGNDYTYFPQKGKNIGEKMSNAFLDMFLKGYESVLL